MGLGRKIQLLERYSKYTRIERLATGSGHRSSRAHNHVLLRFDREEDASPALLAYTGHLATLLGTQGNSSAQHCIF